MYIIKKITIVDKILNITLNLFLFAIFSTNNELITILMNILIKIATL